MSLQRMDLDPVRLYRSLQSGIRRQLESVSSAPINNAMSPVAPETIVGPRMPSHVTRVLGKLCFSCRSVNPLESKYCDECGSPLFRPSDSQMLRQGHPFKDVRS